MDIDSLKFKEFHWVMSLLQAIDVGVIVIDQEYKVQIWNSFMENHSGLRPDKIRGNNLLDFFPEVPKTRLIPYSCFIIAPLAHGNSVHMCSVSKTIARSRVWRNSCIKT